MEFKDYYKILGVEKSASEKDIKSAYRRLARKFHPDVNKEPGAQERFKEINEAYAVLNDAEKRRKYDELGSNWQAYERMGGAPGAGRRTVYTYGPGGTTFDFSDFFETFFGQMGGDRGGSGGVFETIFNFGGGRAPGGTQRGSGGGQRAQRAPERVPGQETEIEVSLEEVARGGERRVTLGGRTATVTIPKGIRQGMKLRIPAEKSGVGSDILLAVKYARHPAFTADGEDISAQVDVPVTLAVVGGEIDVPTLDGTVKMKVPPHTHGGRMMRLRGQGLPRWNAPGRGDELVTLRLVLPADLSEREKDLYREIHRLRYGK